jgi:hypothetical protein
LPVAEGWKAKCSGLEVSEAKWLRQFEEENRQLKHLVAGAILTGPQLEFCRTWRNQTEVTVAGIHFIQEDSPEKIGEALAAFVRSLRGL